MNSFSEERNELEKLLGNFIYRRAQTTEEIESGGRCGPRADEARARLREKTRLIVEAIENAELRAGRGEL